MRKLTVSLGFALTLLLLSHSMAQACGDKLLALGRGVRFQRAYKAAHPATILIYTGQNSKGGSLAAPGLQASLTHAGHRLQVAANVAQAQDLLKSGRFDLVLADFPGAATLAEEARSTPSKPTVLPV